MAEARALSCGTRASRAPVRSESATAFRFLSADASRSPNARDGSVASGSCVDRVRCGDGGTVGSPGAASADGFCAAAFGG